MSSISTDQRDAIVDALRESQGVIKKVIHHEWEEGILFENDDNFPWEKAEKRLYETDLPMVGEGQEDTWAVRAYRKNRNVLDRLPKAKPRKRREER